MNKLSIVNAAAIFMLLLNVVYIHLDRSDMKRAFYKSEVNKLLGTCVKQESSDYVYKLSNPFDTYQIDPQCGVVRHFGKYWRNYKDPEEIVRIFTSLGEPTECLE